MQTTFFLSSILVIFLLPLGTAFALDADPKSYWKFDGNLDDSGALKVKLKNTSPVFICNFNETQYCFELNDKQVGVINFTKTQFKTGFGFNGKTFLTSGFENESKYDFLNSKHPFTIETWITPTKLCDSVTCYHHYFISKTETITHYPKPQVGDARGFACGIQRDGSFYCYFRNVYEYVQVETLSDYTDNETKKLSITYTGGQTWKDIIFYVNGELVQTKPLKKGLQTLKGIKFYVDDDLVKTKAFKKILSNPDGIITHDTMNNQPLVLGNYWIKNINPLVNVVLDEVKIYDYAKSPEIIKADYLSDVNVRK